MAIIKGRLRPEGSNNYGDIVYLETSGEQVKLNNGQTVENLSTEFNTHKVNKSNPHEVTKSQVGLGNVQNYGIATQAEAQAGTSNVKYMTPLRVKEAIVVTKHPTVVDAAVGSTSHILLISTTFQSTYASTPTPLFRFAVGNIKGTLAVTVSAYITSSQAEGTFTVYVYKNGAIASGGAGRTVTSKNSNAPNVITFNISDINLGDTVEVRGSRSEVGIGAVGVSRVEVSVKRVDYPVLDEVPV